MNIGIIGQGFVGNAIFQKFRHFYNVLTYDLQSKLCNSNLNEIYTSCQYIFVCLPTPMDKDGSCYVKIVEDELSKLNIHCQNNQQEKVIIIKSTVPPGTTSKWNKKFSNLTIVFNPEFLTEANAVKDYENQNRIILGGPRKGTTPLKPVFSKVFHKAKIIKTDSTHAEMVKYTINCFLATKVSFANEIYQICNGLDIDYDKVIEYAVYDDRLGYSHWAVPGPDGDFGYGGHCFPKDVKALIQVSLKMGLLSKILVATDEKNNQVRTNRDWEGMTGRAII
jgi:UDPglucose 6-dehydrogenase